MGILDRIFGKKKTISSFNNPEIREAAEGGRRLAAMERRLQKQIEEQATLQRINALQQTAGMTHVPTPEVSSVKNFRETIKEVTDAAEELGMVFPEDDEGSDMSAIMQFLAQGKAATPPSPVNPIHPTEPQPEFIVNEPLLMAFAEQMPQEAREAIHTGVIDENTFVATAAALFNKIKSEPKS